MRIIRVLLASIMLVSLSACSDCGEKKLLFGKCDISQNSQSTGVLKLRATQSKRQYITSQESWKREVEFSNLVTDGTVVDYYCYFYKDQNNMDSRQLCSDLAGLKHEIPWAKFSSEIYRKDYSFIVEAVELETGKLYSSSSIVLSEEIPNVSKYIDCNVEPSTMSGLVSILGNTGNIDVCIKDGQLSGNNINAKIYILKDGKKIYGAEPAPDSSTFKPKFTVNIGGAAPAFTVTADGFEIHGFVFEPNKLDEGHLVAASAAVKMSHLDIRQSSSGRFKSIMRFANANLSFAESELSNIVLPAGKAFVGLEVDNSLSGVNLKNSSFQMYAPSGSTAVIGVKISGEASFSAESSSFDIMSGGHAIKYESGSLSLEKNLFKTRVDSDSLMLISGENKPRGSIELKGNKWVRANSAPDTPEPAIWVQSNNINSLEIKRVDGADGTIKEWACAEDSSIAEFSSMIELNSGLSFPVTHPNDSDLIANSSKITDECDVIPDAIEMSNKPGSWSSDSYGYQN